MARDLILNPLCDAVCWLMWKGVGRLTLAMSGGERVAANTPTATPRPADATVAPATRIAS